MESSLNAEAENSEKEYTHSVEFLEALINTIPAPIYYKNQEGRYLGCNEAFSKEIIGLPKEEIIGNTFLELFTDLPEALEFHKLDMGMLREGKSNTYEDKFRCADGETRDFVVTRNTFKDGKDEATILVGVMQDVTERKKAEEALLNNISFLETLQDNIPSPVFQRDRNGVYISCNESFAGLILGLPKEQVFGTSFLSHQHRLNEKIIEMYHRDNKLLFREGGSQNYETELQCSDGVKRNFLFTKAAYKEATGKVAGIAGVMTDISELKRTEETLVNNVNFLETLLDNIPNPVFQRDRNGVYITCNEKFANFIIGLPKEELIGTTFLSHQHRLNEKIIEVYSRNDELLLQQGGSQDYEAEFKCSDGLERSGIFTKTTYTDSSGKVTGIIGVITDITKRKKAEKELKERTEELSEAKKRLDLALEATKMGIWEWDLNSNTMTWDDNLFHLVGISRKEFNQTYEGLKELSNKIMSSEDNQRMQEAVQKVLEDKTDIYELEHRVIRPDGSIRDFSMKGRVFRNSERKLLRIIGTAHDITDRKETEKALQKSDERFRVASEQTGQIIYDMNLSESRINWTGAIEEITGYSPEEFRNFNVGVWWEHIHPDDRKRVIKRFKEFQNQGKEKFWNEYRLRRKNGSYYYVEDIGVFLKDETGKIYRSIGVHKDISERKLSEKKLQESEERYRSFIQNFKGIAYRLDMNCKPLFMGGDVEKITGYSPEEFLSEKIRWEQLVEPEDRLFLDENGRELGSVPNYIEEWECRIRHRDGEIRWVHEIIQNICDESGTPSIIQGSIYDITEQKVAEKKLKKVEEMRKKEIHHRVKNNLQVISSLLELQADKFDDPKVLEAFRESQNRIISMSIIHEELYKDQNGNRNGNKEKIDFATYLERLTGELVSTYAVKSKGLNMKLDVYRVFLGIDTSIPLGILINELVSNTLKHAFPEGAEIKEIKIRLSKTEDEEYTLVFSDNGTGLPEGFDFRNTDSLGLQLVNTLVDQLEGSIELEEEAKGTKYRIKFRDLG